MSTAGSNVSSRPADRAEVPSAVILLFGVFAAPIAWLIQLIGNYSLAVYPCFSHSVARYQIQGGGHERIWLVGISLLALLIAIAGIGSAVLGLRAMPKDKNGSSLQKRRAQRARALAHVGLLSGVIFGIAILFTLATLMLIPQCAG